MMGYIWNKEFRISKKGIEESSEGKYDQSTLYMYEIVKIKSQKF